MYSIKGFEGRYLITPQGEVYSQLTDKYLKQSLDKDGYKKVGLCREDGVRKTFFVHRLIAQTFIANPDNKPCINHKDGVKTNNRISNLEWCTISENTQHSYDNGLQKKPFGEKNNNNKLSQKDVDAIRMLLSEGVMQKDIAARFNIKQPTVSNIATGRIWGNNKEACSI